ncbi:TK/HMTK protein kinase [Salpingoeca rosetta]|uniref:TK/HMTK protein kinase n=1 Tax=Salpingoeca rosetta (strain ATCC 50818 / BSB-021) TaxID=946362 RepID=F2U4Y0_SALR5|nr:TK/HMTK protein kinase [Salpingoeca rosetta]EGD82696.1 TK/HMTK protein kinase [Salpingoeca rosetta]|eukprot:XP_004995932.1 TK/HMTK protein kinase [Salpingoeca rosetta]
MAEELPDFEALKRQTMMRLTELSVMDEEQRIAIFEMVKDGSLTVEEAVAEVKRTRPKIFTGLKFLGSSPALRPRKQDDAAIASVVSKAHAALKKAKPTKINLVASTLGIKLETAAEEELIENNAIHTIIHAAPVPGSSKLFAIVVLQSRMGLVFTDIVQVAKAKEAKELESVIRDRRTAARKAALAATSASSPASGSTTSEGAADASKDESRRPTLAASQPGADAQGGDDDSDELLISAHMLHYVGSAPAPKDKGEDAVLAAVEALREQVKEKRGPKAKEVTVQDATPAMLVISTEGLKIVDLASKEVVSTSFIKAISHQQVFGGKKAEFFCFIEVDDRRSAIDCHVFLCDRGVKKQADTIYNDVIIAVQEARKRLGNPFRPAASSRNQQVGGAAPILAPLQVPRRQLRPIKAIGAGQFGKVYLAAYGDEDDEEVATTTATSDPAAAGVDLRAVKLLRKSASSEDKVEFLREAETMVRLGPHENLVRLMGVVVGRLPLLVVLEYCQYGDLSDVLKACRKKGMQLRFAEQLHLIKQLASGMQYIASRGFVHMDLAARNCLLHRNSVLKVADFGLTHKHDEGKTYYKQRGVLKLSVRWLAIDAFDHKIFSEKSDVWSYGVTVWEVFTYSKQPYTGNKLQEVLKMVRGGHRLSRPSRCPEDLWRIIASCWDRDPRRRPTFRKLLRGLEQVASAHASDDALQEVRDVGGLLNQNLTEQIKVLTLKKKKKSSVADPKSALMKGLTGVVDEE